MADEAPWEDYPKDESQSQNDDAPWEDYGKPEKSFGETVGDIGNDFVNSMSLGSSIGENIPYIGKPIAHAGTAIGSGITAAMEAPFSDASISDLYKRNMALSQKAEDEQAAYDEKSKTAQAVKSLLGGLVIAPLKRPMPTGGEQGVENIAEAMGTAKPGEFVYPGSAAADKEKLMEYLAKQEAVKKAAGQPSMIQKYGPRILDQAIDTLPYGIRKPIQIIKGMVK